MEILKILHDKKFKYFCLFLTFFLEVFNYSITNQRFLWIKNSIYLWKVFIVLYLVFTVNLTKKETGVVLISILLCIITQPLVYDDNFVGLIILAVFCKDLKENNVIFISVLGLVVGCLINIAVVELCNIPYWISVRNGIALTGLGFTHKNIFPNFLTTIALAIIFLDRKCEWPLFSISSIFSLSFISFSLRSRTPAILLILIGCIQLLKYFSLKNRIMRNVLFKLLKYVPFWVTLIVFFSFCCTVFNNYDIPYVNGLIDSVNNIITGRIDLQTRALNNLGIPLIGIGQITSGYTLRDALILDSAFFLGLYKRGLIFILCFVGFYVYKSNKEFNKGSDIYNLIVFFKAIEGVTEVFFMDFLFTPFLLLIFIDGESDD